MVISTAAIIFIVCLAAMFAAQVFVDPSGGGTGAQKSAATTASPSPWSRGTRSVI